MLFYSDVHKITTQFLRLKTEFIVPILALEVLAFGLRGLRQQKLLACLGIKVSLIESCKVFMAGYSMVATPGGAGEIIKSHFLKQNHGSSFSQTVPLVFIERFHDLLAAVAIIAITLIISYHWQSMLLVVFSSSLLVTIYVILRNTKLLTRVQNRLRKVKFLKKIIPTSEFNDGLNSLITPKMILLGSIISFPSWFLEAVAAYLAFLSFGLNLTFVDTTQFTFSATLFGAFSLLPGGIGITEGSLVGMIVSNGIELATATALVLFIRITTIWFATALGFISAHHVSK